MVYGDDNMTGAGSDSGSNGISNSTIPGPIQNALKPKKPMSAGQAQNAVGSVPPQGAANDPLFENYEWEQPYSAQTVDETDLKYPTPIGAHQYGPSKNDSSSSNASPISDASLGTGVFPVDAQPASAQPATPTLARQGSSNPFVRAIQRITGWTGPQPAPGEPYKGPTDTQGKMGALGNWLGRLSSNYTANFGTPLDRELSVERQKLSNEAAWRYGMLGVNQQKADTAQQNADTKQSQYLGKMREVGYVPSDPNDPNSSMRAMSEPEILSDPVLGQKFNTQMSKMGLTDAQTDKIRDMLMGRFEVDPWVAAVAGSPALSGQKVSAQQYQNIGKVLSAKGIQIKDLGTDGMWAVDRIGNKIHEVSAVAPSVARAQMYAMLRPVQAITPEGNLSWMTAGQAIGQGAAPAGAGASALSKQAQMSDIKVASQNVRQAINSLENPLSPSTIAELTMAARSTDPSVFHTEVDSLLGSQQLTSDQQNFLVWMAQLHERAMSLRNIAGMGQASDKLRDAIIATLPSAKSANRELMTRQLDAFDNMVGNLERGIPIVGRTPVHSAAQSHSSVPTGGSNVDDLVRKYGGR